jgi:hypothetical protein
MEPVLAPSEGANLLFLKDFSARDTVAVTTNGRQVTLRSAYSHYCVPMLKS